MSVLTKFLVSLYGLDQMSILQRSLLGDSQCMRHADGVLDLSHVLGGINKVIFVRGSPYLTSIKVSSAQLLQLLWCNIGPVTILRGAGSPLQEGRPYL